MAMQSDNIRNDELESCVAEDEVDTSYLNVRKYRRIRGMTLRDLAKVSGLSLSYLSNYENGKANISIMTLKKIATALDVPMVNLITDDQKDDVMLIDKEDLYIQPLYKSMTGIAYQKYFVRNSKAMMHVSTCTLPPHSDTGEASSHYGEEFIWALKGTVTVILDGKKYRIEEGNMIYHDSSYLHKVENEQDEEIEFMQVNTPPTF